MTADTREHPLTDRTILVVDDDRDVREMIATVMRIAGATVLEAHGTAEALSIVASRVVDAALLDWHLTDGDCGKLLADLATERPGLSASMAVITGDLLGSTGGELHGHPVLLKPFRPAQLVSFVRDLLERGSGGA